MKITAYILMLMSLFTSCIQLNEVRDEYGETPVGIKNKTKTYISKKPRWITLNDNERVDGYTRIGDYIFGGDIDCHVSPLKEIDINSFKVLSGTGYAKDTNHVYYPIQIDCMDYDDCGACFFSEYIVENVNPQYFKYFENYYVMDDKNVYTFGKLIPFADAQTFKIIKYSNYISFAVDKNRIFWGDDDFNNVDLSTFYLDKKKTRNLNKMFQHKYIIVGDKNTEWKIVSYNMVIETKRK